MCVTSHFQLAQLKAPDTSRSCAALVWQENFFTDFWSTVDDVDELWKFTMWAAQYELHTVHFICLHITSKSISLTMANGCWLTSSVTAFSTRTSAHGTIHRKASKGNLKWLSWNLADHANLWSFQRSSTATSNSLHFRHPVEDRLDDVLLLMFYQPFLNFFLVSKATAIRTYW